MRNLFSIAFLFLALAVGAVAQTPEIACPSFELVGPTARVHDGQTVTVYVESKTVGRSQVDYEWRLSEGTIREGRGTSKIEFLVSTGQSSTQENDSYMLVSVKINGLPGNCISEYSLKIPLAPAIVCFFPIDQYGKLSKGDEMARIDNLFIQLAYSPDAEWFFVIGFASQDSRNYRIARLKRVLDILRYRKYDATRLTFALIADGDEENTTFQIVPKGGEPLGMRPFTLIRAEDLNQKLNTLFSKTIN